MVLASSFLNIIYIVLAIFAILALGGLSGKERDTTQKKLERDEVDIHYKDMPDPTTSDVFRTFLAGARFYNDPEDYHSFVGFIYFDKEDEVPRVYRNDLKMIGHVPRERLWEFKKWCPGESFPCTGMILRSQDYETLNTELRIIKPYNRKYVEKEIKKFINWVILTYGNEARLDPEIYKPLLDQSEIDKCNEVRAQRRKQLKLESLMAAKEKEEKQRLERKERARREKEEKESTVRKLQI